MPHIQNINVLLRIRCLPREIHRCINLYRLLYVLYNVHVIILGRNIIGVFSRTEHKTVVFVTDTTKTNSVGNLGKIPVCDIFSTFLR